MSKNDRRYLGSWYLSKYCFFLGCLFPSFLFGQNLIPNPDFEAVNICKKYQEACSPKAWRSTILKSFKYLTSGNEGAAVNQENRYIQLLLYNPGKTNDRRFAMAPLLCPLEAGQEYEFRLQFYTDKFSIASFGVYFSDTMLIGQDNDYWIGKVPQIVFDFPEPVAQGTWMEISSRFVASGEERAILLGNFLADEMTSYTYFPGYSPKQLKKDYLPGLVYYNFDHLELHALGREVTCDLEQNLVQIYQDSIRHDFEIEPIVGEKKIVNTPVPHPDLLVEKNLVEPIILGQDTIALEKEVVLSAVQFTFNQADLLPTAYPTLDQIVELMSRRLDVNLKINGHTDNIGSAEVNLQLSIRRANTIRDFLIGAGIAPQRLQAFGQGENSPIADNETPAGRQNNRRVVLRFY